jgi:hypothetical protein
MIVPFVGGRSDCCDSTHHDNIAFAALWGE